MPLLAIEDKPRDPALLLLLPCLVPGFVQNDAFRIAARRVEFVEFLGKTGALRVIRAPHKLERDLRVAHAAGRIDARRQLEAHLRGTDVLPVPDAADRFKRRDTRPLRLHKMFQAAVHENAVLPCEAHDVGEPAEGHEVEHSVHNEVLSVFLPEPGVDGSHEEEGHADAGEMGTGHFRGIAHARVEEEGRGRQVLRRQVMVAHDHVHAEFPGPLYGFHVGNARVHGEQDLTALFREFFHGGHVDAVALGMPVRNMPERMEAVELQDIKHDSRARGAVHVIVAPDGELPALQKGFDEEVGCLGNLRPFLRIDQTREGRVEIAVDFLSAAQPPPPEDIHQKR